MTERRAIVNVGGSLSELPSTDILPGVQTFHGFVFPYEVSLSYDKTARTVTITPSGSTFSVWVGGVRYVKTGAQVSTAHTNASGDYYLYYGTDGELAWSADPWDMKVVSPVCYVYYDTVPADGYALFELHTYKRNPEWHESQHFAIGTFVRSGLEISGYTLNGDGDAAVTYQVAAGIIVDEDIEFSISTLSDGGPYTIVRRTGASGYTWDSANTVPYKSGGTWIQYNQVVTGSWQMTEAGAQNRYINYYLFAAPALDAAKRIFVMPGQALHTTLSAAQSESNASLDLTGFALPEVVAVWKLTYLTGNSYTATGRARLVEVNRITNTRGALSVSLTTTTHNLLTGREVADAHPASAITNTPAGTIAATTVQAAIDELDQEKQPLDSDLTAIAALAGTSGLLRKTAANTWSLDTTGYTTNTGTVTSVSGTGTVNGLSLSGTVTTSGSLTLGGTLDLSSPPAIGGTTANTGRFTTLTTTALASIQGARFGVLGSSFDCLAYGVEALKNVTDGRTNIGIGYLAMEHTRTASDNVAIGSQALRYLTFSGLGGAAGLNVAIGSQALANATAGVATLGTITGGSGYVDGTYNGVQLTYASGTAVLSGGSYPTANIVVSGGVVTAVTIVTRGTRFIDVTTVLTCPNTSLGGTGSGFSVPIATLTFANNNMAIGSQALGLTTLGANNVSVGAYANYTNLTGINNVAIGNQAMIGGSTGNYNVAIGGSALNDNASGSYNTAIGYEAGARVGSGNYNTLVGRYKGSASLTSTVALSDGLENIRFWADASGNVGLGGVTTFGTSAAKVLALSNGTAPSSGPADTLQIYSSDLSAGNTIPSIFCEGSGVITANTTAAATHRIAMRINGSVYYFLANTSA